jgi:FAD/FMN-containing dehydrogenase
MIIWDGKSSQANSLFHLNQFSKYCRSSGPNSLLIWTHHLKGLKFHKSFTPKGCNFSIDTPAVTAASGSQFGEIDEQASIRNLTVVSGGAVTVGIGGYLTGGGHGALSAEWGLAADNIYEMEVVTPRGDILTVNECQNQDLFWALRGVCITSTFEPNYLD